MLALRIQSTTLQNDLKKPIESIVFKFYKSGTKQVIAAKLIDPYTINLMKEKEPIDMRKAPADINEIISPDLTTNDKLKMNQEKEIQPLEMLPLPCRMEDFRIATTGYLPQSLKT